jgi:rhodanese-related sulfurtransferase
MFRCCIFLWIVLMIITPHARAAPEYVSPETVPGASTINTAQAKTLFDRGAIFIDVRSDADWEAGRIPGAVYLELDKVFTEASLNQTTEDWHTGCVTLSGAKGLVFRRDASPTAQHDSRPWSSQVYQCRVVRFRCRGTTGPGSGDILQWDQMPAQLYGRSRGCQVGVYAGVLLSPRAP